MHGYVDPDLGWMVGGYITDSLTFARPPEVRIHTYILMSMRGLHGTYAWGLMIRMPCTWGQNNACPCTTLFWCELVVVLSQITLKRRRAELHIDTKIESKRTEMTDVEVNQFSAVYV